MNVIVFTAAIGSTDPVRPPVVSDPHVRYLCFSDRCTTAPPYEWIEVPSSSEPRLASRRYKVLADHPALADASFTLWHDAAYQLTSPVMWWLPLVMGDAIDLAAFRHARAWRTLRAEAKRLVEYGYLSRREAKQHLMRYRADGFTARRGSITCGGLLVRRTSPAVTTFNQAWWTEVQRWGGRDQASLDYCAWKACLKVAHLDGQIKANPFARWRDADLAVPA